MSIARQWSLRARLTALLVATVVPLLALGVYWALWEAHHERARAEREARELAARIAAQTAHRVSGVQEMLAVLARLPAVQGQDRAQAERIFQEVLADLPHLENIALFTADGRLLASSVPAARSARISVGDRAWFQALIRSGKPVDGGFQVGRITGKPVVPLLAPVLDRGGKVLGVVGATLRVAAVSREVAPPLPGTAAGWAVVDGAGLVLLQGGPSLPLGQPVKPRPGMLQAQAAVPGTAWRALVHIPEAAIAARARAIPIRIGSAALLILFTAIAAGLWIAYGTWRSLKDLRAAVRALGAGQMDWRVPEDGPREVSGLARALNEMAGRRQQAEADLEAAVARRDALTQLSADIGGGTDRGDILQRVVSATARLLGTPYAVLWTADWEADRLVAAAEFADPALGAIPPQPPIPLTRSLAGNILQDGSPRALLDVRDHPLWKDSTWIGMTHLGAYAGVSVRKENIPVGILVTMDRPGRAFTGEEMGLLGSLGAHAALALEKATLLEEAREAAGRSQTLLDVSQALTRTLDLGLLLDVIVEKVLSAAAADTCGIARLAPGGGLEYVSLRGNSGSFVLGTVFPRGEGLVGRCLELGRTIWSEDVLDDPDIFFSPEIRACAEGDEVRGALAVPIVTAGGPYGVLFIGWRAARRPPPEEVTFAEALAAQVTVAIQNAGLFAKEQERRRQMEAVQAVSEEVTRELDLNTLLGLINRRAAALVGARSGVVYLWDEQAEVLYPRAWYGFGDWIGRVRLRLGEELAGAIAQRREGMIVNDYRNSPYAESSLLAHSQITTGLGEPLLYHDQLLGVITVNNTAMGRPFTEGDREVLGLFAVQAAIAIQNARLYEESQRQAREAGSLAEVAKVLASSLDPDRVVDQIVQEVQRLMGVPFVGLMALDEERQELAFVRGAGLSQERLAVVRLKVGQGLGGLAMAQGSPTQSANIAQDPRYDRSTGLAEPEGFRSVLCVPLLAGRRSLGILVVFRKDEHEFSPGEVGLMLKFADQAAIAMHNAGVYAAAEEARQVGEQALAQVKRLQGLLPICSYCKKVRNDQNYWQQVESYVAERSEAQFSHGICPDCYQNVAKPAVERIRRTRGRVP